MQATIDGNVFNVEIERKRIKNIYFRFKDSDTLYVTCSKYVPLFEIENLIKKNEASIGRMYKKQVKRIDNDQIFTYLGRRVTKVFDESLKRVSLDDDFIYAKDSKQFDSWYKKECLRVFESRINCLLPYFKNIPPFSLRIRKMSTRWGVNNVTKRIITLNSELLKKDVTLIDYVIVHELCHFYEANHSKRFWENVEKYYPDYKNARKRLRG